MTANCDTDPNTGCKYNHNDGKCHHPRKAQGSALPDYQPGRIRCLWGKCRREDDPIDAIRYMTEKIVERRKTT